MTQNRASPRSRRDRRPLQAVSAARYVALLRAINVGGRSVIKMADLRTVFESAGLSDVSTYIHARWACRTA